MLVATAGHVDHGKTSLVRALTGVETDRLPEERARGISIDLGFAYWRPDGKTIGFVDVPGHERFIRNMLAGVCGVDFALIVVAADDGVMPQSLEHAQILDLLGVSRGIVAVTKCDRSPRERIDDVRTQVRRLLAGTTLAEAQIFEVSSLTGAGLPELGDALRAASSDDARRRSDGRNFRLAIDRVFSVVGTGTVATGTVLGGSLQVNARVVVSPSGLPTRVRGLHAANQAVTSVEAGERCALNLADLEVGQLHRGDCLVAPMAHVPSRRLEVRLKVLSNRTQPLKHNAPVHLHLGAADVTARVLIPGRKAIEPGENAIAQLLLDHDLSTINGDRFVVRDQSDRDLLGGGRVIDPLFAADRRKQAARAPVSTALEQSDPAEALKGLLALASFEVDANWFERIFNLTRAAADALYRQLDVVLLGGSRNLALSGARVRVLSEDIVATLDIFHRAHPELGGLAIRDLKSRISIDISTEALGSVLKILSEKSVVDLGGPLIKLKDHAIRFSPAESAQWRRLQIWQEERGDRPFSIREIVGELGGNESAVASLLTRRISNGDLWIIADNRYALSEQVSALAARAAVLAKETGGFTAAQYRDATGIGRNLAIPLLEFFDRIGVTLRRGDLRTMRSNFESIVGIADPYLPPAPSPQKLPPAGHTNVAPGAMGGAKSPPRKRK